MSAMNIVYEFQNQLYVNVTNKCTNNCEFCIRFTPSGVDNIDLWLEREPSATDIIKELIKKDYKRYNSVVFCGYGEPLIKFDTVAEVARFIKSDSGLEVRVNTNGHANYYKKRDVTPEMEGLFDIVSISLNASTPKEYQRICKCEFGEDGFYEMLDFAKKAKNYVGKVVLSVVDVIGEDEIEACRKIAEDLGVEYRVREYSE